jgi:hypothetical protein
VLETLAGLAVMAIGLEAFYLLFRTVAYIAIGLIGPFDDDPLSSLFLAGGFGIFSLVVLGLILVLAYFLGVLVLHPTS